MTRVPVDEERFQLYFAARLWHLVHEPRAQESWLISYREPMHRSVVRRELHLPFGWPDSERIRVIAWFIGQDSLGMLDYSLVEHMVDRSSDWLARSRWAGRSPTG